MSAETPELTTLKEVFGDVNWASFVTQMPKWESELANYEQAGISLFYIIEKCGFHPLKEAPAMANALVKYFSSEDELPFTRKRSEDKPMEKARSFMNVVEQLKSAAVSADVIDFHLENDQPPLKQGLYKRQCYAETLEAILKCKSPVCVVTGTPGIGKTAFRYYILWLWLQNDKSLSRFDSILFDRGTNCFLVSRNPESGHLSCNKLSEPRQWDSLAQQSFTKILGLFEPLEADTRRQATPELLLSIWTASPGAADAHLHELCKVGATKKFTLMEWSKTEVIEVFGTAANYDKYGGIPRLLELSEADADSKIADGVDVIGMIFSGLRMESKSRLAHRLLLLNEAGRPRDFVSPWVAKQVYNQHKETIWLNSKNFATTLNQLGWAGSTVGNFFEPMYHDSIVKNKAVTINNREVPVTDCMAVTVSVKTTPPVDLNILYLPACRVNDTFDSYVLHQGKNKIYLILLQATVGATHTGGKFSGVVQVVYDEAVKQHKSTPVEMWMVYALPKGHKTSFKRKDMTFESHKQQTTVNLQYDVIEASFDFNL